MTDIFSEQPSDLFGEQVQALLGERKKEINGKNTVTRTKRGFGHSSLGKESSCNSGICLKELATHSSVLAWKIPWTEEPGRLQTTGDARVGHVSSVQWLTRVRLFASP